MVSDALLDGVYDLHELRGGEELGLTEALTEAGHGGVEVSSRVSLEEVSGGRREREGGGREREREGRRGEGGNKGYLYAHHSKITRSSLVYLSITMCISV